MTPLDPSAPAAGSPRLQTSRFLELHNGEARPIADIPVCAFDAFRREILAGIRGGARIAALFARPRAADSLPGGPVTLHAVLVNGESGSLTWGACPVESGFPALTPDCPQADRFEREIAEAWGVLPEGHPWLTPVRFLASARVGPEPGTEGPLPGTGQPFVVRGEEIHEVAVGPVHAGVIEPGHFRFQCHGERVLHLDIFLGYQHRGVERALTGGPNRRTLPLIETLAGDTTVGHATAYCEAVESLAGCGVPVRAQVLRGIALELERLANHIGDLGALAGDVGYLPTAAFCGRLRGEFLNLTALVCGSRFGRGWIRPGGVAFDLDPARVARMQEALGRALADAKEAVGLLWDSPSVQSRFEETGTLTPEIARELGLVGPAARASGLERDARHEIPSGIWRFFQIPMATWHTGDVFARAFVRWLEIERSAAFIRGQLETLPGGPVRAGIGPLAPGQTVATLVEGWRGEICHIAATDEAGAFRDYKVVDPSFHNWSGLAFAMRGQAISDFPLCNKSFNLSYSGHDL